MPKGNGEPMTEKVIWYMTVISRRSKTGFSASVAKCCLTLAWTTQCHVHWSVEQPPPSNLPEIGHQLDDFASTNNDPATFRKQANQKIKINTKARHKCAQLQPNQSLPFLDGVLCLKGFLPRRQFSPDSSPEVSKAVRILSSVW